MKLHIKNGRLIDPEFRVVECIGFRGFRLHDAQAEIHGRKLFAVESEIISRRPARRRP